MKQLDHGLLMKNALNEIHMLRAKLAESEARLHEPIAIVGIACRFPGGATTPARFWENLCKGLSANTEVPADRWDIDAYYAEDLTAPGKMHTRYSCFLDAVDRFDPAFFNIARREAVSMDPQQRLLLEVTWEALEAANIIPATLFDSATGVFIGICEGDYRLLLLEPEAQKIQDELYASTGNATSVAAGRISYLLGLTGPSMAVDTACSSSLVAVHLACQSLRQRECSMALTGGVSLILDPQATVTFSKAGMLAPDGRCKTFDAAADGYVRGEGCGMVVLKRLSDALAADDTILAVIRGSMINQDGHSSGLTAPRGPMQVAVIRQALEQANIVPDAVSYVEAHGTGTPLGDPIEIGALGEVFSQRTTPLWVGSVKTNIGHLEAAAGIAGLIKVILMLQHQQIPPHLHFQRRNPYIDWAHLPIQIPTALTEWTRKELPNEEQIAGISSFGYSGTNAHLILAATSPSRPFQSEGGAERRDERPYHLLALSAKNEAALKALAQHYITFLDNPSLTSVDLGDICYTASVGRSHFDHRVSMVADSIAQMQNRLADNAPIYKVGSPAPTIAFLFSGQGSQYVGMGRALYEAAPVFRAIIDRCEAILLPVLGRSLIELLYPATPPEHNDLLESHPCGQAVTYAIECALADLWRSWGIQPTIVLGHSLGDFAAAYTAGVLTLEDGLRLVVARGRLMESAQGSMVAVLAAEADVLPVIAPFADVTIGVINGPTSLVISGGHENVVAATAQLQAAGFKTRKLDIPVAAHSPLLDPVLDQFEQAVRGVTLTPPTLPVVSSMTGQRVTAELTDPTYWRRHLRNTVRFADGVATLRTQGITLFLEIGPGATLVGLAEQIGHPSSVTAYLPSLRKNQPDWQQMLTSLGELYGRGVAVNWHAFDQPYRRRKVVLPTYPFQRQRYWVAHATDRRAQPGAGTAMRPLIDRMVQLPFQQELLFETALTPAYQPLLEEHRLYGHRVAPGAYHLALLLSALAVEQQQANRQPQQNRPAPLVLEDVTFAQALILPDNEERMAQVVFTPAAHTRPSPPVTFKLFSFTAQPGIGMSEPLIHVTGVAPAAIAVQKPTCHLQAAQQRCTEAVDMVAVYQKMTEAQIILGPSFYWLRDLWSCTTAGQQEILGRLRLPDVVTTLSGYPIHPGLLASCFQAISAASLPTSEEYRPWVVAIQQLQLFQTAQGNEWWCHAQRSVAESWDITLFDQQGEVVMTCRGLALQSLHAPTFDPSLSALAAAPAATPALIAQTQLLGFRQQVNQAAPAKQLSLLEQEIRRVTANTLGLPSADQVDPTQGFMDLGLDSIMAVQLRNQLMLRLEEELPTTLLFDYPTPTDLAVYLAQVVLPIVPTPAALPVETEPAKSGEQAGFDDTDTLLAFMTKKFSEYVAE